MSNAIIIPASVHSDSRGVPRRLDRIEVAAALEGASTIYETEADNDAETLHLTPGGQYIRKCGEDLDRCYVVNEDEAYELALTYAPDEVLRAAFPSRASATA